TVRSTWAPRRGWCSRSRACCGTRCARRAEHQEKAGKRLVSHAPAKLLAALTPSFPQIPVRFPAQAEPVRSDSEEMSGAGEEQQMSIQFRHLTLVPVLVCGLSLAGCGS